MYDFILNFKIKQHGLSPKGIFQTPSPPAGYSLYKQRKSWNTPCLREESPAPPLFMRPLKNVLTLTICKLARDIQPVFGEYLTKYSLI